MNLKREELKELGLTDEQIDKVMASYGKGISSLQQQVTAVTTERDSLKSQVEESGKTIKDLQGKAKGNEEAQQAIKDWQAKAQEAQTQLTNAQKHNAIELALRDAGARNTKAVGALLDQDAIKFENGKITGLNDQLKAVQKDNDYLFQPAKSEEPAAKTATKPGPSITVSGNPDPSSGSKGIDFTHASYEEVAKALESDK